MRFFAIAAAITVLLIPAAGPAAAANTSDQSLARPTITDFTSAKKQKKAKKKPREKVEFMRAVPSGPAK